MSLVNAHFNNAASKSSERGNRGLSVLARPCILYTNHTLEKQLFITGIRIRWPPIGGHRVYVSSFALLCLTCSLFCILQCQRTPQLRIGLRQPRDVGPNDQEEVLGRTDACYWEQNRQGEQMRTVSATNISTVNDKFRSILHVDVCTFFFRKECLRETRERYCHYDNFAPNKHRRRKRRAIKEKKFRLVDEKSRPTKHIAATLTALSPVMGESCWRSKG